MDTRAAPAYAFGPYRLLSAKRVLLRDTTPVPLTPKAFETLLFLIEHRDQVVTKEELLRSVWTDVIVEEGNLTQQIFLLRKALDDSADGHGYIATVPRIGYRFVADVVCEPELEPVRARFGRRGWLVVAAVATAAAGAVFIDARIRSGTAAPPQLTFAKVTGEPGVEAFPTFSPDGQFFIYAQGPIDYPGESDIYMGRVGGARPVNLTPESRGADTQPALSADGQYIAFRSERMGGGIFRMRVTGESVQRVTGTGYNPTWSPDGKRLAYSTQSTAASPYARGAVGEVWTVDVHSGASKRIAAGDAMQPHWSPHGHRIAYWGKRAIYTVPASGGESAQVSEASATRPGEFPWNPVWSHDGKYLYFSSNRGGSMNFWRVPIDELSGRVLGTPQPITAPTTFAAHLSVSASGDRIAFASLPIRASIQRIDFDPASGRVLGEPIAVTKDSDSWVWPEPSPDGRFLAFHSGPLTRAEDIFVSARDGSDLRQLTEDPMADRVARWSSDGQQIAFYSMRSGSWNIWTIKADGSGLRQVTSVREGQSAIFPAWSPDGRRMSAMLAGRGAFIFEPDRPWDEHNVQFLPPIDAERRFQAWSWSPDGRSIAGSNASDGGVMIYSIEKRTYESITAFGSTPAWLSDNRRLMFAFENRLFLVDRTTRSVTELMSFGEGRVQLAAGGGFSVTRDSRAIYVTPVVREGDIWMATMK
jgi:Tol biopolymer transport system component/DNA-binding winged helix-turn-helix (wHTH) protein